VRIPASARTDSTVTSRLLSRAERADGKCRTIDAGHPQCSGQSERSPSSAFSSLRANRNLSRESPSLGVVTFQPRRIPSSRNGKGCKVGDRNRFRILSHRGENASCLRERTTGIAISTLFDTGDQPCHITRVFVSTHANRMRNVKRLVKK